MKANIVLDYINDFLQGNTSALNDLKQYALEEITIKNNKCSDITKARIAYAKKKATDKKEVRSALKGAFINDGKMILCDGAIFVLRQNITENYPLNIPNIGE